MGQLYKTTKSSVKVLDSLVRIVYNSLLTSLVKQIGALISGHYYSKQTTATFWENHRVENANRLVKQVKLSLINTYKVYWFSNPETRQLARKISVLHPRHTVDKGSIKIENELTYARN